MRVTRHNTGSYDATHNGFEAHVYRHPDLGGLWVAQYASDASGPYRTKREALRCFKVFAEQAEWDNDWGWVLPSK